MDATWGCLGFLDPEYFLLSFLIQGFFSAFWGGLGDTFCVYLGHDPIIIQSMSLAVPIVAEAFANIQNIDKPVSFLSIFGAIFALAGNFKIQ